jgi:hypothetical protein
MNLAKAYVYDYETVSNCFLGVFINIRNPKDIIIFETSSFKNQIKDHVDFLNNAAKNNVLLVSFNGLKFDNQISRKAQSLHTKNKSGVEIAKIIYDTAQDVIRRANSHEFPIFTKKDNPFKECDILAINNYDNPAKRSSLKWLQYSMDWHNVEDMSKSHTEFHNERDILGLTSYCINDCLSTRELFFKNKSEIILRSKLSQHFDLNLYNSSEPNLAKEIFLKTLSEKMNVPKYELRKMRTYRKTIIMDEIILPYISFKTKPLKDTLIKFKKLILDGENLKGSFKHETTYRGLNISFALGGIHGAKQGVYKSDKDFIIKSFDVTSFYPNLAIRNKWAPAHIPNKIFCEIYEWMFEERKKYDKKNPLNYMYKICLNSTYGLSNEENSFLKDSSFTMKITCNGQLLLVMLMEELCESIPGAMPIMVNTDGGELKIPIEYEDKFYEICKKWKTQTKLELEYEDYDSLYIGDVNNYISIFKGKEISKELALKMNAEEFPKPLIKKKRDGTYWHYKNKCKGRFEVDKPLHKNKSYRIHRIALYNYFLHKIDPEETIKVSKNIMDYCAGVRAKGEWKFVATCLEDGSILDNKLPKTLRYYRSTQGCKVRKIKEEGVTVKAIKLEADNTLEVIMNRYDATIDFDDYKVDVNYHLKCIRNEIKKINPFTIQTDLFS